MSTSTRPSVIDPDKSYTFRDYFRLNPPVDELLQYFGYQHRVQHYQLPQKPVDSFHVAALQQELEETLLYVDLNSETARREALISPVLLHLARLLKIRVRMEYPLSVTYQLNGILDYLLQKAGNFFVVEAKDENLQRGFTQLATELIALDQWQEQGNSTLYAAVSIGNVWQFGILDRATKTVTQDLNLYRVPTDLNLLLQILTAILEQQTNS